MPRYIYRCLKCEKETEAFQSFDDPPLVICTCGGELKKKIQPVGVVFKANGFYSTDKVKNENIPD